MFTGQSPFPSLFASASQPQRDSNIIDLRIRPKQSRIRQNLKENDEDNDFIKASEESEESINKNEALPSLVQKKIGKILNKLQLISTLRGSPNHRGVTNNNDNDGDDFEFSVDDDNEDDVFKATTFQPNFEQENLLEGDNKENAKQKSTNRATFLRAEPSNNFNVSPGNIVVFFMELVGTIAGLAYGAAAQLTDGNRRFA